MNALPCRLHDNSPSAVIAQTEMCFSFGICLCLCLLIESIMKLKQSNSSCHKYEDRETFILFSLSALATVMCALVPCPVCSSKNRIFPGESSTV